MKVVTAVLVGAGDRGANAYASYAINNPGTIKFVAVAEKNDEKRKNFQKVHGIPDDMAFANWDDLFAKGRIADAILICTNENFHYEPTKKAIELGYNILLEKPITNDPETSLEIGDLAADYDKVFMLCYVLRYTPFFAEIKKVIDSGAIGKLKSIVMMEHTGMAHFAHSYVRGVFSKTADAGPMILSKCCHDMDILNWFIGSKCKKLSSYATKSFFCAENAPEGAPMRCTDGCVHSDKCYFYAPKVYSAPRSGFNVDMISLDKSPEGKLKALAEGRFGRCVYHCDNDVVDTQIINMLYENGVTVSFSQTAYSEECYRSIQISGTMGEITGKFEDNEFTVKEFATGNHYVNKVATVVDRHGGGDYFIMTDFIKHIREGNVGGRTEAKGSVDSHVMCFAAEYSQRHDGEEIDLEEYKKSFK